MYGLNRPVLIATKNLEIERIELKTESNAMDQVKAAMNKVYSCLIHTDDTSSVTNGEHSPEEQMTIIASNGTRSSVVSPVTPEDEMDTLMDHAGDRN